MAKRYFIVLHTGNQFDASGTSAKVFIQLLGQAGKSPEIRLDNPTKNDFEPGGLDRFEIEAPDIGKLEGIRVRHDNTGNSPGWFLECVQITEQSSAADSWYADICRWLTHESGGTLEVTHELKPSRAGWMKALYDRFTTSTGNPFGDVPLCQLPIPGTHDSATFDLGALARTQNRTIAEQLYRGIRFFDFRVKYSDGKFYPFHGATNLAEADSKHYYARWSGDDDWRPSDRYMDEEKCIFGEIREFLKENKHEVIIIKIQSFEKYGAKDFDESIHKKLRILIDSYFSMIAPGPVSALTLNQIYTGPGRVLVFYKRDKLIPKDYTDTKDPWAKFWPYLVPPSQTKERVALELLDPYWGDDFGSHSIDSDAVTYHHVWLPYHIQNLCDWQARSMARFFATQAHHQALPTASGHISAIDIAKTTNTKNIEQVAAWLKNGVPEANGKLRPNIVLLDYIEHPGQQAKLADAIVEYFTTLTPERFRQDYQYHNFNLIPVYTLQNPKIADSYRFATSNSDAWVRLNDGFLVYRTQAPDTVRVYEEKSQDGRYHYSTRDAEVAKKNGWARTGEVFYAYDKMRPGTIPIYREIRDKSAPEKYFYSARDKAIAEKNGWRQLEAAFYAYECFPDAVPVYRYYETDRPGYYRFSRNARLGHKDGLEPTTGAFRAFGQDAPGRVAVYEEKSADGRYHYSTRSAKDAEKNQWKRQSIAFWAYDKELPGTVPVWRETPAKKPHERYNYAPRSAAEAKKNGWEQLDIAFWAYQYRYE